MPFLTCQALQEMKNVALFGDLPYPLAECFRILVLDHSPILLCEDVSAAVLSATGTGLCHLIIKLVAIVKGQFLAGFDVPQRHNPDGAGGRVDFTIWIAGMVDIAGFISEHPAVDIPVIVENKNVCIALAQAFFAL